MFDVKTKCLNADMKITGLRGNYLGSYVRNILPKLRDL